MKICVESFNLKDRVYMVTFMRKSVRLFASVPLSHDMLCPGSVLYPTVSALMHEYMGVYLVYLSKISKVP